LSWTRKALSISIMALATAGLTAVVAETIVVRSTGPSAGAYPPGKSIPANGKLALKAGDQLVILDARGTRALKGPGSFDLSAGASSGAASSTFSALLRNTGTRQVRTGAVRGAGGDKPVHSPNLWFVDVAKAGNVCVSDPQTLSLWRASMASASGLTITRVSDGKSASLSFATGQTVKAWPVADLPVTDGAQFKLAAQGAASPKLVKFVIVGPSSQAVETTVSALIRNNCAAQLDLVVETVAVSGNEASGG
jgi:hypothetical protein